MVTCTECHMCGERVCVENVVCAYLNYKFVDVKILRRRHSHDHLIK